MVQPEYLYPTSDAASFYSSRVYFQVQSWKERDNLNPKDWGSKEKKKKLFPLYTSTDVITQDVAAKETAINEPVLVVGII